MVADIIIDIILAIILLIGFFWGLKIGFVKTIAKPVKFIMAIFLSISFASLVGTGIIDPMIREPIINKMTEFFAEKIAQGMGTADELPTLVKFAAGLAGVDIESITSAEAQAELVASIVSAVTDPVLNLITSIIAFFILYFVFKILLTIGFAIVNSIIDNGVVGIVNRILGCVVTTFFAMMIVWGLCSISDLILNLPGINEVEWVQGFSGGWVYNFFKGLSPIDLLLGLLFSF